MYCEVRKVVRKRLCEPSVGSGEGKSGDVVWSQAAVVCVL